MTGEMKVSALVINDISLLSPERKHLLETLIVKTFVKAQSKAQEVAGEKTKEIL
jgi:DNA-binding protein YbaB